MSPTGGPAFLGPHVVGQRVVVRRIVPGETGPSGGPAMSDLLGICEAWTATTASIRAEDGTLVEIPVEHIVSGKPVPPRPSVRSRVSTRAAESHAAPLWTGVEREPLGDWELRAVPVPEGRLLKRTNSCLAIGDPGTDLATAERTVRTWYADRNRSALIQVEIESEVEAALLAAGWRLVPEGEAAFWMGSASRAARAGSSAAALGELRTDGPRLEVIAQDAQVRGALDGDWLGIHGLYVAPEARRQGRAVGVLRTLIEAGSERGALTVWLHVETDNEPAQRLYASLGLTEHHRCRYLRSPAR